jgi:hypothetical protein
MNARTLIAVLAVALVAALFFVFRPGDDDDSTETVVTPTTVATTGETETTATTESTPTTTQSQLTVRWRIDTRDDRIDRLRVKQGSLLQLIVDADTSDHVHVHGYDLMRDVAPGTPAQLRFQATLTGRFEIELEDAGEEIAQLTVVP